MSEDVDAEIAQIEEEIKALDNNPSGSSSSIPDNKNKDTLIALAREMIESEDSRKFAHLDQKFIGIPRMPINTYLEIATYCETEGMGELAEIFKKESENVLATSLSIQGLFVKLLVTQIKKEEKSPETTEKKKESWGLFSKSHKVND
jgi:hypothetical protein